MIDDTKLDVPIRDFRSFGIPYRVDQQLTREYL